MVPPTSVCPANFLPPAAGHKICFFFPCLAKHRVLACRGAAIKKTGGLAVVQYVAVGRCLVYFCRGGGGGIMVLPRAATTTTHPAVSCSAQNQQEPDNRCPFSIIVTPAGFAKDRLHASKTDGRYGWTCDHLEGWVEVYGLRRVAPE